MKEREPEYFIQLQDKRLQCRLCPHACILADGDSGLCEARCNENGTMKIPFYGEISSIALDPIEKKPLRHFLPGTETFSVGFWHCTMRCPFCQNWEIAHPERVDRKRIAPEKLIDMALASGSPSISFTYSEPTLHIEYLKDCMLLAREKGLKTILVTNGNLLEAPARDILSLTDATNVDLKSFSSRIYHESLGGELKVVLKFIQVAFTLCHVEVTSLLVPGILDDQKQIEGIASFLSSISKSIPLHITSYHPAYLWDKPAFSLSRTEAIAAPAFQILDTVFLSRPYSR